MSTEKYTKKGINSFTLLFMNKENSKTYCSQRVAAKVCTTHNVLIFYSWSWTLYVKVSRNFWVFILNTYNLHTVVKFGHICLMAYQPSWVISGQKDSCKRTAVALFNPKFKDKEVNIFPGSINLKVNAIARLEFELV